MKKLSKKKWLIVIVIFTVLFILRDPLYNYFTFEQDTEDLIHLGSEKIQEIKDHIIKSGLSVGNLKFQLTSILGFVIPIVYIVLGYEYNNIKNKLLKYNIGKNNNYNKKIIKEKIMLSMLGVTVIGLIYGLLIIIGYFFAGGIIKGDIYFEGYLSEISILYKLFGKDNLYIIFVAIHILIGTFLNGIFVFYVIDKFKYIKGILLYLAYMWIGTIVLYYILNQMSCGFKFIVPMESIVGHSNTGMTFIKWVSSFIGILIPIAVIKGITKIEVE